MPVLIAFIFIVCLMVFGAGPIVGTAVSVVVATDVATGRNKHNPDILSPYGFTGDRQGKRAFQP